MEFFGRVYVLLLNGQKIYVGCTTYPLNWRLMKHRNRSKEQPNRKLYKYVLENGGWENVTIEQLETVECTTKQDLFKKEQEWFDNIQPLCNGFRPLGMPIEQKRERNKLYMRDWRANRRVQNS